jgi:23S rRNA pseudouridine2605 synthase
MSTKHTEGDRIAKVIARAGVASRRDAEKLVEAGVVTVNGKIVTQPATNVGPNDKIVVDGKLLDAPEPTRIWLYHKPVGLVTSAKDEQGRPTIFDNLPEGLPRVMSIGRLDINSEGLLLLTNDGELKRRLELPSTGWLRKYRVRVNGRPTDETFEPLRKGITADGEDFQPMTVSLDRQQGANAWLTVGLREGKNREIRRAMEAIGLQVNRLIRVAYGPFQIGTLKEGEVDEVRRRVLRDQVGVIFDNREESDIHRPRVARNRRPKADDQSLDFEVPSKDGFQAARPAAAEKPRGRNMDPTDTSRRFKPRKTAATGDVEAAPKARKPRSSAPRASDGAPAARGERSFGKTFSARPARDGAPSSGKPARGFKADGDRRAPREDGKPSARPARAGGKFEGRDDKRCFGERGEKRSPKPYGDGPARAPRGEGKPYAPKTGGRPFRSDEDRPARSGGKSFEGRDDKRSYGERSEKRSPKPYGDGPARAPRGEGKPYAPKAGGRPFKSDDGSAPRGPRSAGKPFGGKPSGRSEGGSFAGRSGKPPARSGGKPTGFSKGPRPGGKPGPGKPRK